MKHYLFVSWILVLTSCTSVPLSSMLKMATLDRNDILAIKADEVRVRLAVTEPVELQTKNVRLVLQFEHRDAKTSEFQYLLEIIEADTIQPISSWFSKSRLKHRYEFRLSRLSQLEFNKYQKNQFEKGQPASYHWTVYYYLKNRGEQTKGTNIDMELKLSSQDDFFFLLKDAPIKIN